MGKVSKKKIRRGLTADDIDLNDGVNSFGGKYAVTEGSALYAKLTAKCKAAARRKFDVYPSAYANMWASKQQKKGKC